MDTPGLFRAPARHEAQCHVALNNLEAEMPVLDTAEAEWDAILRLVETPSQADREEAARRAQALADDIEKLADLSSELCAALARAAGGGSA